MEIKTELFHELLAIKDAISDAKKTMDNLKEREKSLEAEVTESIVDAGLMGVIIGTKQLVLTEKIVASIHNKIDAIQLLKDLKMDSFIKEDIVTASINGYINELTQEEQELIEDMKAKNGNESESVDLVREKFGDTITKYTFYKLGIKKA